MRLALEFLILTAARSGEARSAAWSEIDADAALWILPARRMKARRARRWERRRAPRRAGGPAVVGLDDLQTRSLAACGASAHGFRSTFRGGAAERTDAPHAVMEAVLAHAVRDRTEAAYARTGLVERRRASMEDWATYLGMAPAPPDCG